MNTNIDGRTKIMYAMTSIKGCGRRFSNLVLKKADIDLTKRAGELSEEEVGHWRTLGWLPPAPRAPVSSSKGEVSLIRRKEKSKVKTIDDDVAKVPEGGGDMKETLADNAKLKAENAKLKAENARLKEQLEEVKVIHGSMQALMQKLHDANADADEEASSDADADADTDADADADTEEQSKVKTTPKDRDDVQRAKVPEEEPALGKAGKGRKRGGRRKSKTKLGGPNGIR